MSIFKIQPEYIDTFSLETHPKRTYTSSSLTGSVGLVNVFPRRSSSEKEAMPLSMYSGSLYSDINLNQFLETARQQASSSNNNNVIVTAYMSGVNAQQASVRKQQQVDIIRFKPGFSINKDFMRKSVVKNILMPYYRGPYPSSHFGYTNYNCLNFFSASTVPSSSVLMYPNPVTTSNGTKVTGPYIFSGSFSFDFHINPRYTSDLNNPANFGAGTIYHLSSCYALSLITGSSKDVKGYPDKFRILLQLSTSTDTPPRDINTSSLPELSYLSEDNTLLRNTWNHVTVRWGTNSYNLGSGSFIINDVTKGTFIIPSASVTPNDFSPSSDNPSILFIGNYYEGTNAGTSTTALWFSADTAYRDGLIELDATPSVFAPDTYTFRHPLNAEVHNLKLFGKYLLDHEILNLRTSSVNRNADGLLFHLPPFFTEESPTRRALNGIGGIYESPFYMLDGTTTTPFSRELAFSVGGHYINLENYTRDMVTGRYPRLWELTGSIITSPNIMPETANVLLYRTGSILKRSITVLPSDDGLFYPNFENNLSHLSTASFVNDFANKDMSLVTLNNLFSTGSNVFPGLIGENTGSILAGLYGPDPSLTGTLDTAPGSAYTILQRTRDPSSNQIMMFDISNLYYGNRIKPGTFLIKDPNISGSSGKLSMTLKDDGMGNIYRADSSGSVHASWNSVGNIFYNEGIVLIKSPHLYFFGEDQFEISFNGEQNVHILRMNLPAHAMTLVSSSNPTYNTNISASTMANDTDQKFVYVTGLNLHDDNLNVISRMSLSQPIVKRSGDRYVFVYKMHY